VLNAELPACHSRKDSTRYIERMRTTFRLGTAQTVQRAGGSGRSPRWCEMSHRAGRPTERCGIFGGTFDPPHVGHLVAAVNVRHALRLDRILLVVANHPWQKVGTRDISPAADRLAMVEAAVREVDGLEASAIEIERGGTSYTADTLASLAA